MAGKKVAGWYFLQGTSDPVCPTLPIKGRRPNVNLGIFGKPHKILLGL
jgi:hypothetical protein